MNVAIEHLKDMKFIRIYLQETPTFLILPTRKNMILKTN